MDDFRAFTAYWRMSGQFLIASILFFSLSLGFGHEASEVEACKKGASLSRFVLWLFLLCRKFCFSVPFKTAGGRWYLAPGVELGNLEVCQRTPDSVLVRPGPVRVFLDLSGSMWYVLIFPLCFSGSIC